MGYIKILATVFIITLVIVISWVLTLNVIIPVMIFIWTVKLKAIIAIVTILLIMGACVALMEA